MRKELDTMYGIALNGVLSQEENRLEECYSTISKALKALDTVKSLFRLKGNCLQIYCPFADNDDNYMFVKELETEEELNAWKEVLL